LSFVLNFHPYFMYAIGLDIGGANLKAADVAGSCLTRPFAFWEAPQRLAGELKTLLSAFSKPDVLAVTMTAELTDCFSTKAEGVDSILGAVEKVANGTPVYVWQTGSEFVVPSVAREIPLLVAAANWHAQATWLGRMVPDSTALLIDVGSTTTDIIPLFNGVPVPRGLTDCERLQSGELVYTGVRRTGLCAVAGSVPFRGTQCPLAAEHFATTLDVFLLLGLVGEDAADCRTANGKPATVVEGHRRLARMLCCDESEFNRDDAIVMAQFLADAQRQQIISAVDRVIAQAEDEFRAVLVSGSGEFLAERIADEHVRLRSAEVTALSNLFDAQSAEAACAVAVATLASERLV
jgi:probable H4MPT-linked C1 transfer pathway protein